MERRERKEGGTMRRKGGGEREGKRARGAERGRREDESGRGVNLR